MNFFRVAHYKIFIMSSDIVSVHPVWDNCNSTMDGNLVFYWLKITRLVFPPHWPSKPLWFSYGFLRVPRYQNFLCLQIQFRSSLWWM